MYARFHVLAKLTTIEYKLAKCNQVREDHRKTHTYDASKYHEEAKVLASRLSLPEPPPLTLDGGGLVMRQALERVFGKSGYRNVGRI